MLLSRSEQQPLADAPEPSLWRLALGGFGLIFAAAALLWWRFGAAVFVDSLTAVWNCI